METKEGFGVWLRRELTRREWKYPDLAQRTGVSTASISRWVNSVEVPSSENSIRIAEAFFVDPDDVLALAGHRVADKPFPPDDPITEIYRMMRGMRQTPDRIAGIRAIVQMFLETDRDTQGNRSITEA